MLASLTCRLLFASRPAWRELGDAEVEARLPSPALHGAALGGLSAWSVALAVYCRSVFELSPAALRAAELSPAALRAAGGEFSGAVRCTLAAISGCAGATGLAVWFIPILLQRAQLDPTRAARFASVVSFPLAAGGLALCLPTLTASLTAIALLGVLAYRSGSHGAGVYLGLAKRERTRAALLTALVATLPALLAAPLCPAR